MSFSRMKAIMIFIKNKNDKTIILQLYQQKDKKIRKITDIVNVDTILLVKKFYFKIIKNDNISFNIKFSFFDNFRT